MTDAYDRTRTGWELDHRGEHVPRPAGERVRCGPYTAPDGEPSWGDHRVTYPGTTCVQVDCHVAHHPTAMPGWSEPCDGDFYTRPGVKQVAAALYGWDGGLLPRPIGDTLAWVAGHIALDALRDAGYTITPPAEDPT